VHSSGTLVDRAGGTAPIAADRVMLQPGRVWKSAATGASYPVEWRLVMPDAQLDVMARPLVDAQEMAGFASGVAYWEGAVDLRGTHDGHPVLGRGYLEMTGYAGRPMSEVLGAAR
jgi:predicted secreted hydrolase